MKSEKPELIIQMVQANLHWEDKQKNLDMFTGILDEMPRNTDLVILPEMFSTGFSMRPEMFAESNNGTAVQWMIRSAQHLGTALTGSLIIEESGMYYNRLFWVFPDGSYKTYDKRHLFSLAGEEKHYTAGRKQLLVDYRGWKIMPLICYDLRFPVWSRNVFDYDLLIYVANWPERRNYPWKQLLRARAIENMSYVAGVNRCGKDGNGVFHSGDTACIDPLGAPVAEAPPGEQVITTAVIKKEVVSAARKKFGFLNDRDRFTIQL